MEGELATVRLFKENGLEVVTGLGAVLDPDEGGISSIDPKDCINRTDVHCPRNYQGELCPCEYLI